MKHIIGWAVGVAIWLLAASLPTVAQEAPTKGPMDERALEILRGMGDYLKSRQQFTFEGEVEEEDILSTGQKLHRHKQMRVYVRRPNRLRSETVSVEHGWQQHWYDGRTFTSVDLRANTFAQVEVPPTIDETIEFMFEEYNLLRPLSELAEKDPYESITKEIETAAYLGRDRVRGKLCHHVAVTQQFIDWQAWVEDGPVPLLRKVVIDYRREFGEPQYTVTFDKWNMNAELADFVFAFIPRPGSKRIQFMPFEEQKEPPGQEPGRSDGRSQSKRGK